MSVRKCLDGVNYVESPCHGLGAQGEEKGDQEPSEGTPPLC